MATDTVGTLFLSAVFKALSVTIWDLPLPQMMPFKGQE